jgi:hypothetical protein
VFDDIADLSTLFAERMEKKAVKAMQVLEYGLDDVTAMLALPKPYRKRLMKGCVMYGL